MPAAVEFVKRHQHQCERQILDGVTMQTDHAQHLRVAAVTQRHLELDAVDRDVDAER